MPNHLHVLIDFDKSAKSINTIVSNGKRFMAYTMAERLKEHNKADILKQLSEAVCASDKDKGKIHQVFERSFDCKEITSHHFLMRKLLYIHDNPCIGVWKLAENPIDYIHSSAKYYATGEQGIYSIKINEPMVILKQYTNSFLKARRVLLRSKPEEETRLRIQSLNLSLITFFIFIHVLGR